MPALWTILPSIMRHLHPDGLLVFNVTNRFVALAPVVEKIALSKGLHPALVHDEADNTQFRRPTMYWSRAIRRR